MNRKIIISAGHGGNDPGAVANGYTERDLAIEFRELLVKELLLLGVKPLIDDNKNALKQTLQWLKGVLKSDKTVCIDIHWNAAIPKARGTEIIIPDKPSLFESSFAKEILDVFVSNGFTSRGVKTESQTARKRLGWMRPLAENILIEMAFLTNTLDLELYKMVKYKLAKELAVVIKKSLV
jgi:N-acetylmuramoyl-L-alanine amidase